MIYYVNAKAKKKGNGSKGYPFKTINEAASVAQAGDEVIVKPGIYREKVIPRFGGTEEKRITYRSEKPLGAVITGSEVLKGWKNFKGDVWTAKVDNGIFGGYNPYTTFVCGDWYFAPTVRHTGSVVLNGLMMYETTSLEECIEGKADPCAWNQKESEYKWYCEQEGEAPIPQYNDCGEKSEYVVNAQTKDIKTGRFTVFYCNFKGLDPNKQEVEILARRNCFMPEENGLNYITVDGFKICNGATTWAPPASYQDGLIGPHWSKGWIFENLEVCNSRCCGISLGKYRDEENDMYFYTKHLKSPTQMERDAVCRGQYHGWVKEKVGSHMVRRCHIHHCEQTGIVGRMGAVFSTIEDCHIHHICNSQQLGGAETAGIKLHAGIDVLIQRNHIHDSIIGVWLDWEAQGARITQNLMYNNARPEGLEPAQGAMFSADVFIEVGHGPTIIDNNMLLSKVSITIPSEGIAVVHNLVLGSFSLINSGVDSIVNDQREPRYTPYHIRHRTEVAGFMTILHGDDRIYNNIFVQNCAVKDKERTAQSTDYEVVGTSPFDIFPTYDEWIANFMMGKEPDMGALAKYHFGHLPVWVGGNAYFNGATVCKHEKDMLVGKGKVKISLKDGVLKNNLSQFLGDYTTGVISTDVLGYAFEPEQRFENRDESDIIFNEDYFGNHRGTHVIPGPFAELKDEIEVLQ
ncbi:MAG: right-handed parallel beta-helix repeat-containing protein [Spirochaetaceae bacterium]|nr:right-handed parallel beta-helix repeat-containing protein [Spirochaetaceae bacterium]